MPPPSQLCWKKAAYRNPGTLSQRDLACPGRPVCSPPVCSPFKAPCQQARPALPGREARVAHILQEASPAACVTCSSPALIPPAHPDTASSAALGLSPPQGRNPALQGPQAAPPGDAGEPPGQRAGPSTSHSCKFRPVPRGLRARCPFTLPEAGHFSSAQERGSEPLWLAPRPGLALVALWDSVAEPLMRWSWHLWALLCPG